MVKIAIHAVKYEIMIERRGRTVSWEKAIQCSCVNVNTKSPTYGCAACNGFGFTYEEAQEGKGLVMGITSSKVFQDMAGVFEAGDVVLTVPYRIPSRHPKTGLLDQTMKTATINPMFNIGENDKVTLLDDSMEFSEVLIRGKPVNNRPPETLLYGHVTNVRSVRRTDPATGDIYDYEYGQHFIVEDRQVVWLTPDAPSEGEQYTIVYKHRPTYMVIPTQLPKPRFQDGQNLPRYVAMRYLTGGVLPS
jgi:hypothetical protein